MEKIRPLVRSPVSYNSVNPGDRFFGEAYNKNLEMAEIFEANKETYKAMQYYDVAANDAKLGELGKRLIEYPAKKAVRMWMRMGRFDMALREAKEFLGEKEIRRIAFEKQMFEFMRNRGDPMLI